MYTAHPIRLSCTGCYNFLSESRSQHNFKEQQMTPVSHQFPTSFPPVSHLFLSSRQTLDDGRKLRRETVKSRDGGGCLKLPTIVVCVSDLRHNIYIYNGHVTKKSLPVSLTGSSASICPCLLVKSSVYCS